MNTSSPTTSLVVVPGTSFKITRRFLEFTLATQEASLGAGDFYRFFQAVEGPNWRELNNDVHSLSLLVRSSVANLNFTAYLQQATNAQSLVKLCNIPAANTWTLIQLPNLPVFPGGFGSDAPGAVGYFMGVTLACGSTYIAPAADTWQSSGTGNFIGAPGMTNFAAQAC